MFATKNTSRLPSTVIASCIISVRVPKASRPPHKVSKLSAESPNVQPKSTGSTCRIRSPSDNLYVLISSPPFGFKEVQRRGMTLGKSSPHRHAILSDRRKINTVFQRLPCAWQAFRSTRTHRSKYPHETEYNGTSRRRSHPSACPRKRHRRTT